jgi:hypothetical protein
MGLTGWKTVLGALLRSSRWLSDFAAQRPALETVLSNPRSAVGYLNILALT